MTTAPLSDCRDAPIPPATALNDEQYAGRSCFACGKPLTHGAISCGWAVGRSGVHILDVEVWACP